MELSLWIQLFSGTNSGIFVLVIKIFTLMQVVAELNSTYSVEAIFNSSNAQSYANGTWSATLTGLRECTKYKIYVTILDAALQDPIILRSSVVSILTASSTYVYQLFCSFSNIVGSNFNVIRLAKL